MLTPSKPAIDMPFSALDTDMYVATGLRHDRNGRTLQRPYKRVHICSRNQDTDRLKNVNIVRSARHGVVDVPYFSNMTSSSLSLFFLGLRGGSVNKMRLSEKFFTCEKMMSIRHKH